MRFVNYKTMDRKLFLGLEIGDIELEKHAYLARVQTYIFERLALSIAAYLFKHHKPLIDEMISTEEFKLLVAQELAKHIELQYK